MSVITRHAIFSPCGKYRYQLLRNWDILNPSTVMCIGLNPSTADGIDDDPTIRILMKHLACQGFGGLIMCNLYALISSSPAALWNTSDPQGENQHWLDEAASRAQGIIFCWGTFKGIEHRAKQVAEMFPQGLCFGRSKNGQPLHPMALMYQGIKPGSYALQPYIR